MVDGVRFILNDQPVDVSDVSPMTTLLDWLRDHRGLKGTKEGCAEGDCGACTVVLERADGRREAINACIALLGQIDGQAVRTVEGLRRPDGTTHPVQAALADADATQCGFCTPGFVMSAYAFAAGDEKPDPETIHDALAGNLCRCTGYRPIVEAMTRIAGLPIEPASAAPLRTGSAAFGAFHAPRSLGELLALRAGHPEALLLAGATDLGLLASRSRKPPAAIIHVAHCRSDGDREGKRDLIGAAAATPGDAAADRHYPALRIYLAPGLAADRTVGTSAAYRHGLADRRHAARAAGAGAGFHCSARGTRPGAGGFFLGYRGTALLADEVIQSLTLPKLWPGEMFFCDKLSKRRDGISTVAAGYRLRVKNGRSRCAHRPAAWQRRRRAAMSSRR
jgi:xanthine dehydrogenase small subunit